MSRPIGERFARSAMSLALITVWPACARSLLPTCDQPIAFTPWDDAQPDRRDPLTRGEQTADLADGLVAWYQRRLRADDPPGLGCRLAPSCSTFARLALRKWRVLGLVLIADRLFVREHPYMATNYIARCPGGAPVLDDPIP